MPLGMVYWLSNKSKVVSSAPIYLIDSEIVTLLIIKSSLLMFSNTC